METFMRQKKFMECFENSRYYFRILDIGRKFERHWSNVNNYNICSLRRNCDSIATFKAQRKLHKTIFKTLYTYQLSHGAKYSIVNISQDSQKYLRNEGNICDIVRGQSAITSLSLIWKHITTGKRNIKKQECSLIAFQKEM